MCGPLLRVSFVQDEHNMRKLMSLSWNHIENNTVVSLNMECIFLMKHGSMSWSRTKQAINLIQNYISILFQPFLL